LSKWYGWNFILQVSENSKELEGLQATLEKLVHHREKSKVKGLNLHAFIYFIAIHNLSDRTVTLTGRKWVLSNDDGTTTVVEGEKIVGETPVISPGESFSYNSYHVTHLSANASGSFHGMDEFGEKIHVRLSPFRLKVPDSSPPSEENLLS
jgi:ApaG protein